jgi:uncharacterized protein
MIHPETRLAFINETIGYGVVATEFIPMGTVVWVRDPLDMVLDKADVASLSPLYKPMIDRYAYEEEDGSVILCWDHARFVNHSCEATCLTAGHAFEIAVRDIQPGEQLTDDYAGLYIKESFPCACGSSQCRRVVRPEDLHTMTPNWRVMVKAALTVAPGVRQPMFQLLSDKNRKAVERGGFSNGVSHHP